MPRRRASEPKVKDNAEPPSPPEAPEIQRRVQLARLQLVGVPLLALLPLAALIGVFDSGPGTQANSGQAFELAIEQPTRLRFGRDYNFTITVRNTSSAPLSEVTVSIDQQLLQAFSQVQLSPSASAIVDDQTRVELGELAAGQESSVDVSFRARDMGSLSGSVEVSAAASAPLTSQISFLVYP